MKHIIRDKPKVIYSIVNGVKYELLRCKYLNTLTIQQEQRLLEIIEEVTETVIENHCSEKY